MKAKIKSIKVRIFVFWFSVVLYWAHFVNLWNASEKWKIIIATFTTPLALGLVVLFWFMREDKDFDK